MKDFNPSYIGLREDLLKHIKGNNRDVLDVGCATGSNGKYLLHTGIAKCVHGVEGDLKMAEIARMDLTEVFCGDLNDEGFLQQILEVPTKYDYIIFGDVLEHLIDPIKVLKTFTEKLNTEGEIIISLPNIAHIELLIQVFLKGTWPQNNRGIFDKTHLRWFTKKDAEVMINSCGLEIQYYEPIYRARDVVGAEFDWKTKLIKKINHQWLTFQHIFICRHG